MPNDTSPDGPIWRRPWTDVEHVVLDLETTGTDPRDARVCEIAWVRRDARGRVITEHEALVHAGVPVGASAAIHGLEDDMLADAAPLSSLASALAEALEGAVLVGHRIAYDLSFLSAAALRGELQAPPLHALDTQRLAQRCTHGISTSLRGLAERFALPLPTHRAAADVRATAALFDTLLRELQPGTAHDLWVAQSVEGRAQMRDDVRAVIAQAMELGRVVRLRYRVPGRPPIEDELEPWALAEAHVEGLLTAKGRRVLRGDRILWATLGARQFVAPIHWTSAMPR